MSVNTNEIMSKLAAPFAPEQISWRAQSVTKKEPFKAMALAYIDARDVMNRLDEVVGPGNWQCRYPHADKKTICEIGVKIDGEWVWKANGAGDTDIEAEKGAISDAFKRAAVVWGIGRYLYDMPTPWVPCELYNGKFSSWKGNPWEYLPKGKKQSDTPAKKENDTAKSQSKAAQNLTLDERYDAAVTAIKAAEDEATLRKLTESKNYLNLLSELAAAKKTELQNVAAGRFEKLMDKQATEAAA